jgi:peptidoglycan hydrolase-like protein with peptidoglycan-binding domain
VPPTGGANRSEPDRPQPRILIGHQGAILEAREPITGKHVKTLQALLNLFLTAGDVGEDGTPVVPLTLDGTGGANTKQATLWFQTAAHLNPDTIVGPLTWRKLIEQDF